MELEYLFVFFITFFLSLVLTIVVRTIAIKRNIVDLPDGKRKRHRGPIPLLGGLAVFLAFAGVTSYYLIFTEKLVGDNFLFKNIIKEVIASIIIMLGGYLDDRYNLKPSRQIIWPILAVLVVIISGIGIKIYTTSVRRSAISGDSTRINSPIALIL